MEQTKSVPILSYVEVATQQGKYWLRLGWTDNSHDVLMTHEMAKQLVDVLANMTKEDDGS